MLTDFVVGFCGIDITRDAVNKRCFGMQAEIQQAFRDYQSGRLQEC